MLTIVIMIIVVVVIIIIMIRSLLVVVVEVVVVVVVVVITVRLAWTKNVPFPNWARTASSTFAVKLSFCGSCGNAELCYVLI